MIKFLSFSVNKKWRNQTQRRLFAHPSLPLEWWYQKGINGVWSIELDMKTGLMADTALLSDYRLLLASGAGNGSLISRTLTHPPIFHSRGIASHRSWNVIGYPSIWFFYSPKYCIFYKVCCVIGMDCGCSREMEVLQEMACNMLVDYQGNSPIHFNR